MKNIKILWSSQNMTFYRWDSWGSKIIKTEVGWLTRTVIIIHNDDPELQENSSMFSVLCFMKRETQLWKYLIQLGNISIPNG